MQKTYRTDIDGLRAIAVISVILFHLGYLVNGYLGVDVFFVISGYLITGIVFNEVEDNRFSILRFYESRVRRIIPLVLLISLVALVLGILYMLPEDLESLSQSIVATNFSGNNVFMKITSFYYWAVQNDYKPLMHTWSLGIEEQFYFLYPVIFFFLKGDRKRFILPFLLFLTLLSFSAFALSKDASAKFYFLQYRFFELSIGGICAIFFKKRQALIDFAKSQYLLFALLASVVFLLYFNLIHSNDVKVVITTILTALILVFGGMHFEKNRVYKFLISNKVLTAIGKISFSLYMWHHLVFAFSRYLLVEIITFKYAVMLSALVVVLSILSYNLIENPFRNRKLIKIKPLLVMLGVIFLAITSTAFYINRVGGVIRDVPELGISKYKSLPEFDWLHLRTNNTMRYNDDIVNLDKPFSDGVQVGSSGHKRIKVLVMGNSFGRDFVNVLLESSFKNKIEVRYSKVLSIEDKEEFRKRIDDADYVFFASDFSTKNNFQSFKTAYNLDMNKVIMVGEKDFGNTNGIHYNRKIADYNTYRTSLKIGVLENNQVLKKEWGDRYIDLLELIANPSGQVLVFTPDGKFISPDTLHLTKFGASFLATLLDAKLKEILI